MDSLKKFKKYEPLNSFSKHIEIIEANQNLCLI